MGASGITITLVITYNKCHTGELPMQAEAVLHINMHAQHNIVHVIAVTKA